MTTGQLLERLRSDEFEVPLVASTPRVLRQTLLRCPEIRKLRDAYDAGCLPDEQIRSFVDYLMRDGARGDRFPYQVAVAAIAVMLELRFSPFADEYLSDLSRIRSERFSLASRVARECLDSRATRIGTNVREFCYPNTNVEMTVQWSTPVDSGNGQYVVGGTPAYPCFQVS